MVKIIKNINTVDLKNISKLKDDDYVFIVFKKDFDLNYRIIDKMMDIGIFDGVLYVFDYNVDLRLRVELDNIDSMFSFSLEV